MVATLSLATFTMSTVWRRSTVWSTSLVMRRSSKIPLCCMPRPKTMGNCGTGSHCSNDHQGPRGNLETSAVCISLLLHLANLTNRGSLLLLALPLWWCPSLSHLAPSLRCWPSSHLHWHHGSCYLWLDLFGLWEKSSRCSFANSDLLMFQSWVLLTFCIHFLN
jgi:hypothetical protein